MSIYGMGDELEVEAAATAPVTKEMAVKAKASLKSMQRSLKNWLKYRKVNDAGYAEGIPTSVLEDRYWYEQPLANEIHILLAEVFDASQLPSPDVTKDPNAAAKLAEIAIAGKLPGDASAPEAAGVIWMWPLVIVVGAIAFVITSSIRSNAEVAKEKARIECIKSGKCTDWGFWLKLGGMAMVGYILWDKLGLGAKAKGMIKGKA
ncbi:MAG: hypothetical protein KJO40_13495 [Deltaproteobacteria bacterium]|nr:hypothetical protein [Deltaproteobacteria bacterium]